MKYFDENKDYRLDSSFENSIVSNGTIRPADIIHNIMNYLYSSVSNTSNGYAFIKAVIIIYEEVSKYFQEGNFETQKFISENVSYDRGRLEKFKMGHFEYKPIQFFFNDGNNSIIETFKDIVFDAVEQICPVWMYFGASEGDGASVGFWSCVDENPELEILANYHPDDEEKDDDAILNSVKYSESEYEKHDEVVEKAEATKPHIEEIDSLNKELGLGYGDVVFNIVGSNIIYYSKTITDEELNDVIDKVSQNGSFMESLVNTYKFADGENKWALKPVMIYFLNKYGFLNIS